MSGRQDREKRKAERLEAESQVSSKDRRARILQIAAGAVFLVIAAVVVVIVISSSSSSGGDAGNLKEISAVDSLVNGVPQTGMVLGDPGAKVEVIEFGDLQCPVCKAFSEEVLPQVIEGQVVQGQAKIDFRNFTIIGPQSPAAGAAAIAAGEQGRGWEYLELFYRNQGQENSGYADDEFLTAVAKGAGVKNISKWNEDRNSAKITGEVEATTAEAKRLGFEGTPSLAIKGPSTNGLELLGNISSSGELEEAINSAS